MDILHAAEQQTNSILNFLPFILIMVILYFFMIRPQNKKQQEKEKMISEVKKGDSIVTSGGIIGIISGFKNNNQTVIISVDKNTDLSIIKSSISSVIKKVDTNKKQITKNK